MANVYFFRRNDMPQNVRDGDWSYVPNWYSNSAKTISLNRLPLANDTVNFEYVISSNVGTFAGDVIGGEFSVLADPNAVWTGNVTATYLCAGTFSKKVTLGGTYSYIAGGTYTSNCTISGGYYAQFSNNIPSYAEWGFSRSNLNPVFQGPITINVFGLHFNRSYTYPSNLKFNTRFFFTNTQMDGDDSGSPTGQWNETPVFMGDISTSNTGATDYKFFGGQFLGSPTIYAGNNTVSCASLGFAANMSNDIVVTTLGSSYINVYNPQDYNTRTITSNIQIIGPGANSITRYYSSFDGGPYLCKMIHAPKSNISLIMGANGTYTLDTTKWPKNVFRFGEPEVYAPFNTQPYAPGEYIPSANLTNLPVTTTNLGAILNDY
jgi:hypothetical protein